MTNYLRAYREPATDAEQPGGPMRFVASTEGVARDGLIIEADGWDLANFKRNPVILWAHDLVGARPPIGRADKIFVDGKKLIADVVFDQDDDFARSIENKYRNGFLRAVSVGWDTQEFAPPKPGGAPRITKAELLEISAVPVGSDPSALKTQQAHALRSLAAELEALATDAPQPQPDQGEPIAEMRPYPSEHACRVREPGDFQANSFRRTSRDHEGKRYDVIMGKLTGDDAMTVQAYRYPKDIWTPSEARAHCRDHDGKTFEPATEQASVDPFEAWEDTAADMVRLYLPDARMTERERRREYFRLAKVYRRAGKSPPEWIGIEDLSVLDFSEVRGLFGEGEPDLCPELFHDTLRTRAGQVLSKRNHDDIAQAIGLLNGVLKRAEKEAEQAGAQEPPSEPDRTIDPIFAAMIDPSAGFEMP